MQKKIKFAKYTVLFAATLSFSLTATSQKWENLATTPPMGWSTWNTFAGNINQNTIKEIADAMISSGLADCGYNYLNIDDCWHGERDADGNIQCDPDKFPDGMKALADYIHSKGLKLGIYSDAGCMTCAGKPGSLGHEYQDALTYANWGIDYLKYDWCYTTDQNPVGSYRLMRDALRAAGRPILFSICEWGASQPWKWASDVGHLWRTTGDINATFDYSRNYGGNYECLSVLQILDKNEPLRQYAGPGHWNDPDMLEVGNGMTVNQDRAHFSLWCMMAAPLILGNDLRSMSDETKAIISNKDVIAIDQDPAGIQGWRFMVKDGIEYWFKPLAGDEWALCIFNRTNSSQNVRLDWARLKAYDDFTKRWFDPVNIKYNVKNLWTGKKEYATDKNREITIPEYDVALYRLTPPNK